MKKLLLILLVLLLPAALFAEFRLGPTAFMNFPLIQDNTYNVPELDGIDPSDFTFGVDARLKILLFQASAAALFTPGAEATDSLGDPVVLPASMDIFLDAGIAIDILILRIGLGVGPNFSFFFGNEDTISDPQSMGFNLKGTADIVLGPVSFGLSYINQFDFDLDHPVSVLSADKTQGLLGVAVLFKL